MWAKYAYNANITQAQMLADIVAILTGTTDKTTLSAGCDQANTTISAAYDAAGWTVHDAAAGTNAQVIKAACQGDAAQFKYVKVSTVNAGQVHTGLWESWNAGTHTGTNLVNSGETSNTYSQRYSTTTVGTMYISASSGRLIMYGVSSAGNGSASYPGSASGILESGRDYSWCGVGQGYVPAAHWRGQQYIVSPRYLDGNQTVQTGVTTASTLVSTLGATIGTSFASAGAPGATGPHLPVGKWTTWANSNSMPIFSGFTPSGAMSVAIGNALDEFSYDSKTWIIVPHNLTLGTNITMAVPKG